MEQAPTHQPGEQFGPFTLERALGRGAAAEVWMAVEAGDLGFQKRQALKLLKPPPGEMETQKKALINEARVCGRLKHPGVVDVYKVGEQNGELYIAMEYVDGPDLNTLLVAMRKRGVQVPVRASIEAAVDLAEALDYAHNAEDDEGDNLGIVHRDLKPSNVLVDRRGILKISDWGLVKSSLNIESTTRGIVKGTPGYIAPEVWGGTRDFKPAADLFAVGAMLYEFVVGERLFQGRNLARIAEQVARRKPEDEAARVADRCPDLVPVLTKLLQRAPGRRYQTGAELAEELRPLAEAADGDGLKTFLRSVRPLVDEISPQHTTQRFKRSSQADAPRPDGGSDAGPGPAAAARDERSDSVVSTQDDIEPDLTATDEQPAYKPDQLGPAADTVTAEEFFDDETKAQAASTIDPEDSQSVPSLFSDAAFPEGSAAADMPATRAMPASTKMPAVATATVEHPASKPGASAAGPDATSGSVSGSVSGPSTSAADPRSASVPPSSSTSGERSAPQRRRRRRRRPPPPPKKMPPPALAFAVAAIGLLVLALGVAAFVYAGGLELLGG